MQHDPNLMKLILEYVEQHRNGRFIEVPVFNGYDKSQVEYHVDLCRQADCIRGQGTMGGFFPSELTWSGVQELERLRNQDQG